MVPYGLQKRLSRGVDLVIYLTFACNYKCSYCGLKMPISYPDPVMAFPDGPMEKTKLTVEGWKDFITNFPIKIREIKLTGGEPVFYNGFIQLSNWILEQGYFLHINTNLSTTYKLTHINPSSRLYIQATYHPSETPLSGFLYNQERVSEEHRVETQQIGKVVEQGMRKIPWSTMEDAKKTFKRTLVVAPDGAIYTSCYNVVRANLKERNEKNKP